MSSLTYDLTLAGLSVGSAAALTGIGLVVTYRATGVLNFAHGAIAMVCAYVLRQCVVEWGWPLWLAATVTLALPAPAVGGGPGRFVLPPPASPATGPAAPLAASSGVCRVLGVGVAAVLADQDVGGEGGQQWRHDGIEGSQPGLVSGTCREGDVDRVALGVRAADLVRETGAGEQGSGILVQADGQDSGIVPERGLDAVAVVDVDVDIRDALRTLGKQPSDGDGRVVVYAEA